MYQRLQPYPNEYPTLGDLLSNGVQVFDDSWSTYVPEHKEQLIQKIIDRYFFEEIGVDTPCRFVFNINAQLRQIMPYYNQLYQSELININPLLTHSINASTRSIENLLKHVNTTNDKVAKAIRDFAGVTTALHNGNKLGEVDTNVHTDGLTHDEGDVTTNQKETKEKITNDDFKEDTTTTSTGTTTTDGTEKTTGTTDTNTTEHSTTNRDLDGDRVTTPETTETKEIEYGSVESSTKKTDGTATRTGTSTDNWTENTIDSSTTTTDTTLKETTAADGRKDFADTPQVNLATNDIRTDYLTNVTWTDDDSSHDSTTKQTQKYDDQLDKTHTGDGSKNENDQTTENVAGDVKKTGSDTETTTKSGTETTTTNENETTTKDGRINSSETVDTNVKTDETVTTQSTEDQNKLGERDISENETRLMDTRQSTNMNTTETGDEHTTGTSKSTETNTTNQNVTEKRNISEITANTENQGTEQTTDLGESTVTSGFMNVSSSELLEAFRRTFLNIDAMIVEELSTNFLLTM